MARITLLVNRREYFAKSNGLEIKPTGKCTTLVDTFEGLDNKKDIPKLKLETNEDQNSHSRQFFVDLMRVVAIFFVVILHTSESVTNHWNKIPLFDWMSGNVYNSFSRFCVPVLFMLTGFLLLDKEESLGVFFGKRLRKIIIPLIAWSVIYLFLSQSYSNYTLFNAIKSMTRTIFIGPAYYHLWFLYSLIPIYLLIPILRVFTKGASQTVTWYFILLCFFSATILQPVERLIGFDSGVSFKLISEYIGLVLLGRQLGKIHFSSTWVAASVIVLVSSTIYTIYATYTATVEAGRLIGRYYSYESINVTLMTICVFIILKAIGELPALLSRPAIVNFFARLSKTGFGIYLFHIIVLTGLQKGEFGFTLSAYTFQPIYAIPLLALLVFLASFIIIALMQKIPILREIVP